MCSTLERRAHATQQRLAENAASNSAEAQHSTVRDARIQTSPMQFLVENNVPVAVIKQWLGHGSERMIRRYTHHRPEYHSAILAQLPSVFAGQNIEKIALLVPNRNLTERRWSRNLLKHRD